MQRVTKLISKSGKRRQGHTYLRERGVPKTILDKTPSDWKQIVVLTERGYNRTDGKPAMLSTTMHIRDY